jgi:predicted nucleic acid-binding protein
MASRSLNGFAVHAWKRNFGASKLFPSENSVPFGFLEAQIAGQLYRRIKRARGREADLAIAAIAISNAASLWTLNVHDFEDVPALTLWNP